jgi:hypothetical protein
MKNSLLIFLTAIGIYALITIPALVFPPMYILSIGYVIVYGWFAWFLFFVFYQLLEVLKISYERKMTGLFVSIIPAVAFAFHMLEVFDVEDNVWHSDQFLLFPIVAVISGWISLYNFRNKLKYTEVDETEFSE